MRRTEHGIAIGPSRVVADANGLSIDFDEITMPVPSRVRGRVRIHLEGLARHVEHLDAAAEHRWRPLAPFARAEVRLERPRLEWSGSAYVDSNEGDVALESSFSKWTWSRNNLDGRTAVYYDVVERDGRENRIALAFGAGGGNETLPASARLPLSRTRWRLDRYTRGDADARPRQLARLVDSPFYSRSVIASRVLGRDCDGVHEHLSLDRFVKPWVQLMIPFRMPRARR